MQAISLYGFSAQQQTSTFRRRKFGMLYMKFSVIFNELCRNFKKQQEVAKKLLKLK